MARYKKPVRIPFPDEEPDYETRGLMYEFDQDTLDLIIETALASERQEIPGNYDFRKARWVA